MPVDLKSFVLPEKKVRLRELPGSQQAFDVSVVGADGSRNKGENVKGSAQGNRDLHVCRMISKRLIGRCDAGKGMALLFVK
mmetsp:Transcript_28105/g.65921  ORF Transcript_28105/g.65921 Transcript_28105/m.65921 type:complete len:81 (+) Transcript_28105:917-1159(+)